MSNLSSNHEENIIVQCPECQNKYRVDKKLLVKPKTVRCIDCSYTWLYKNDELHKDHKKDLESQPSLEEVEYRQNYIGDFDYEEDVSNAQNEDLVSIDEKIAENKGEKNIDIKQNQDGQLKLDAEKIKDKLLKTPKYIDFGDDLQKKVDEEDLNTEHEIKKQEDLYSDTQEENNSDESLDQKDLHDDIQAKNTKEKQLDADEEKLLSVDKKDNDIFEDLFAELEQLKNARSILSDVVKNESNNLINDEKSDLNKNEDELWDEEEEEEDAYVIEDEEDEEEVEFDSNNNQSKNDNNNNNQEIDEENLPEEDVDNGEEYGEEQQDDQEEEFAEEQKNSGYNILLVVLVVILLLFNIGLGMANFSNKLPDFLRGAFNIVGIKNLDNIKIINFKPVISYNRKYSNLVLNYTLYNASEKKFNVKELKLDIYDTEDNLHSYIIKLKNGALEPGQYKKFEYQILALKFNIKKMELSMANQYVYYKK